MDLDPTTRALFAGQQGVATRCQLLALGHADHDLRRMLRRRQIAVVHRGVYADHTGALDWAAKAMAAVLFHPRSALSHQSALDRSGSPIHVAIEHPRTGAALPGVRLHRVRHLQGRVQWHRTPPCVRIEEAALDVAAAARSTADAVAVLAGVVQRRETTAERVLERLDARARLARGVELRAILRDVADGTHSVLEQQLLSRVVRPHGLPVGEAQLRAASHQHGVVYRDRCWEAHGLVVELDGRAWHDTTEARTEDGWRDLGAAKDGLLTLRLGWSHVNEHACRTAAELGEVMQRRGWTGDLVGCGPACPAVGRISVTR